MANCFATSVGSKALTVKQAVVIASVCEFFGALLMGSNVAKTIRKGIADVNCYKDNPGLLIYGMTCVIIAVAVWLVLASYLELPVSTTHSCVGGIIGMTLMTRSTRCVIWNKDPDNMAFENFPWTGGVAQIVISWVLSPVASGVCAAALYAVVRYGIFAWENCYLRARIAFPFVVFFTVTVNVTYFIVKGAKGQAERFGTVGMVREAKEEGNLAPAIGMGSIFGAVAAAIAAGMLPMLSKKVEAEDFTDAVAGAAADAADVDAKAADAEAGVADVEAEATEIDGAKAYIGGQLARDTHKDLKTDKVVGAIHANVKSFDPRAEFFFRYVQVFTAMVDSFAPVWKSNSSAPRRRDDVGNLTHCLISIQVLARRQRRRERHGPLRGRLPRVQEGRGPVEAGDARRGHAVDPGARRCWHRGGPGDVRLQDHERHGRQADGHHAVARHVHRVGRGLRHHLRDGPGLAAQYHSLPDRRHGRRGPLRGPQGRQRLALRQVLLRLGHHARRRRHDDGAPRRALARAAQGRVLRQLLPGQFPRVDAVSVVLRTRATLPRARSSRYRPNAPWSSRSTRGARATAHVSPVPLLTP